MRVVLGELPDLPHVPELPARGPGADMVGRGAAFLPDLPVDLQPSGWRFVPRPGTDSRRAADFLARDLDAVEELAAAYDGVFKTQVCGPWTLAANVELHRGDRALSDRAAVRDIGEALAEGVAAHVADLRRRLPLAEIVVQVDEPSLPAVRLGRIPTASGFGAVAAVPDPDLVGLLRPVLAAAPSGVHCCAAGVPYGVVRDAGAEFLSLDAAYAELDPLGELVDAGVRLLLGTSDDGAAVRTLWQRLSYPAEMLGERVVVTPPCGLAGVSPDEAVAAYRRVREAARRLSEGG